MTDLVCPNCVPSDPPHGSGLYPTVKVKRVVTGDAEIRADGELGRHTHEYHDEYLEAVCSGCGEDLLED